MKFRGGKKEAKRKCVSNIMSFSLERFAPKQGGACGHVHSETLVSGLTSCLFIKVELTSVM